MEISTVNLEGRTSAKKSNFSLDKKTQNDYLPEDLQVINMWFLSDFLNQYAIY